MTCRVNNGNIYALNGNIGEGSGFESCRVLSFFILLPFPTLLHLNVECFQISPARMEISASIRKYEMDSKFCFWDQNSHNKSAKLAKKDLDKQLRCQINYLPLCLFDHNYTIAV